MELKHFSDDHSLKLYEVLEVENCTCDGCGEHIPVKSSRYRCYRYDFDLHPSCAELPRDLQHPIHLKHPLILHKTPPYDGRTCTCKACDLPCRQFVYHCSREAQTDREERSTDREERSTDREKRE
jgi:hypothetical protein